MEDSVRSLVNPPLPPLGPWKFLHPSENLGATALLVLSKRAQDARYITLFGFVLLQRNK